MFAKPGLVVAIIGPDAAGKTTLAAGLAAACRAERDVAVVHLGSPPVRPASGTARLILRGIRWFTRRLGITRELAWFEVASALLDAADRRALARRVQFMATAGTMVITDRYPGQVAGAASGPRLRADGGWFQRWSAATELGLYQSIPAPDLVIRLRVPLGETLRRNAERDVPKPEAMIRRSHEAATLVEYPGVPEIPLENVGNISLVTQTLRTRLAGFLDQASRRDADAPS